METIPVTRQDLHRYLDGCAWPSNPTICVPIARDNGAPATLLAQLEALPNRLYLSEAELAEELERAGAIFPGKGTAMMAGQAGVHQGMAVVGTDGHTVGKVKEVRDHDFILDRRLARDLCVPSDAVRDVQAGQVVLNMPAEDVNYQSWECTKLL